MKPTLLLVDDCEGLRTEIRGMLAQDFEICGEAIDGVSALEKLKFLRPNLILIDLVMPKMSGLEVAEEILRQENSNKTNIVFLSGVEDPNIIQKALTIGARDYVLKPPKKDQLVGALRRALQTKTEI